MASSEIWLLLRRPGFKRSSSRSLHATLLAFGALAAAAGRLVGLLTG